MMAVPLEELHTGRPELKPNAWHATKSTRRASRHRVERPGADAPGRPRRHRAASDLVTV